MKPTDKPSNSQERIKELMSFFSVNQTELANKTGVGRTAIANYIKGIREPKQDAVYMLSKPFNINPVWLMGYDVPMFAAYDAHIAEIADVITSRDKVITDEEKELISAYRDADTLTQQMVKRILKVGE